MGGETYVFDVKLDSENYMGSVHDSISHIIYDRLNNGDEKAQDIFEVYSPTRLLTEGEDSGSWYDTEDWAITGSSSGGTLIIGQSISCKDKPLLENGVPKDVMQLKNFERRIRASQQAYQRLDGLYSVGVNCSEEEVEGLENEIESVVNDGGSYKLELVVNELEKGADLNWDKVADAYMESP